jgi:ABC-type branched-subunit amino acid transport system ATPase component/predicted MFS family arabinose efflux permease
MTLLTGPMAWARHRFESVTSGLPTFPLVVLFFLYFFDEFDTAAFGTLAPEIQKAFDLTDNAFAAVVLVNISVILLAAIPIGHFGDRLPRTKLVVAGAIVAGAFSFATGLAVGVAALVATRIGNGVGLVVNDPIHTSLLSDYYRPGDRPRLFALHRNAQRLGAVVGPGVAGIMAVLFSWRAAFMVLVVPMVAMALVARRLHNPVRGESEDAESALIAAQEEPVPFARGVRMLFAVNTLKRQYLAWLFIGAGLIPLAFYLPLLFEREFGLGVFERGLIGSVNAAASFAGVLIAGRWTAGWLAKGMGEPLKRAGWALVAVGPGLLLLANAPNLGTAIVIAVTTSFIAGMFTPAFFTTQAFVSPARVRSLSFSFGLLFIVVGVWLLWLFTGVSQISDERGIRAGVAALAPYWIIGGLILRSGHRFVAEDAKRALDILVTTAQLRRERMDSSSSSILVVRDLDVSYGQVQVLFGVNMDLAEGEIVALLGTNGAGKSTLLRAISGLVPIQRGAIFFDGEDVTGLEPEDSFAAGLIHVPGGRGIFPGLTVRENLDVAAWATRRPTPESRVAVDEVLDIFPQLRTRLDVPASVLSGGQQQMLTLGQAFIARPKLLMIDELSLGLAPILVEELLRLVRSLHETGTSVILVEQSVNLALTVAERAHFMEKGEIRFSGLTAELLERDDILRAVFLTGAASLETARQ